MKRRRHLRQAYLDGGGRDEFKALFTRRHDRLPDVRDVDGAAAERTLGGARSSSHTAA